jgi:hypothetical protein
VLVNAQIPDEIYQIYAERKPERPQVALADTLKEFVRLKPGEPRLILTGEDLKRLNALVGIPLESPSQLLSWLEKSEKVAVDELAVRLNLGQRQRLEAQARFFLRPGADPVANFKEFVETQLQRALTTLVGA